MAEDSAAYYRSLFLGQVEMGEQGKKGGSKRCKSTGGGPSSVRKSKKRAITPPPEEVVEVGEDIVASTEVAVPSEVTATSIDVAAPLAVVEVTPKSATAAASSEVAAAFPPADTAATEVTAGPLTLFTSVDHPDSLPESLVV